MKELKSAVIVSRHGVRSPTWPLERLNRYSAAPWPEWEVGPGILTPRGRDLVRSMGGFYRQWFQEGGLLGPSTAGYFHADAEERTIDSAKALAEGLLPGMELPIQSMPLGEVDPLFDPIEAGVAKEDVHKGLAAIEARIGSQADVLLDTHRAALDLLVEVLNGSGKAAASIFDQPFSLAPGRYGVVLNGPLGLAAMLSENLLLEYVNGRSGVEWGWGRLTVEDLEKLLSLRAAYSDLTRRTQYVASIRGSNLLSGVMRSLEQVVVGGAVEGAIPPPGTTLVVLAGHDTNISNLAGMLGLTWRLPGFPQDDSPPGGALVFTLWNAPGSGEQYSVRLQFVSQSLEQMREAMPLSLENPPHVTDLFPECGWEAFQSTMTAAIVPDCVARAAHGKTV